MVRRTPGGHPRVATAAARPGRSEPLALTAPARYAAAHAIAGRRPRHRPHGGRALHGSTTIDISTHLETRRFDAIEPIADRWNDLADRLAAPPFLRPGWVRAWLAAFAPHAPQQISTVWRGADLVALTPVIVEDGAVWTPTNHHMPIWGFLAVDGEAGDALAGDLVADRPDRVVVELVEVDDPAAGAVTSGLARRGYRELVDDEFASPVTDIIGPWEQFEQRLSTRRRSQLRRYARRLGEQGTVTIATSDGTEDLDTLLAEGFAVEASGWKGEEGTAIGSDPTTARFYTDIARWAADRGELRLDFLRLDGRPIAFQYRLEHGDTVWYLKAGYDEDHGKWSPSIQLLVSTLRATVEDTALRRFAWLGSTERYKREWSDRLDVCRSTTWYGPTMRGRAAYTTRVAAGRAKEVVRERLPDETIERLKEARRRVRGGGG